jgi:diacylglycerol kinase (ATP)
MPGDARDVPILANPTAGRGPSRRAVEELVDELRRRGLRPAICHGREEFSACLSARGAAVCCVVAAGGDGTVSEVLNRAPGLPLAVLPAGTENLVAREFGIGRDGRGLAAVIAEGRVRCLDLGRANGRSFALMASAGIDAAIVHDLHRSRRGHITHLTYLPSVGRAMLAYRFPRLEVEIEETGERLRAVQAFVFNLPRYGLGLPIGPEARPDDGRLDLYLMQRPMVADILRLLRAIVTRRNRDLPPSEHRAIRRAMIRSERPVPFQVDGDPAGYLPVTVEAVPCGMRLVVPA